VLRANKNRDDSDVGIATIGLINRKRVSMIMIQVMKEGINFEWWL
jgi:hypothetical protein